MTRFTDGPAAGRSLALKLSPRFLRVTTTARGGLDALDQPTDGPRANETCHAYRLERIEKLNAIVCVRGKGGGRSFSSIAHYRLNEIQPTQAVMQSSRDWAEWTREQSLILLCDSREGGRRCPWFRPGEAVLVVGYPHGIMAAEVRGMLVNDQSEHDTLKLFDPGLVVAVGSMSCFLPPRGQPHVLTVGKGANDCATLPEAVVANWWQDVFRAADRTAAEKRHATQTGNRESPFDQFDTTYEVLL